MASAHDQIEVHKSQQIAIVNDQMARRAHWRTRAIKALAGFGAVWATVSAALLARGC